LIAEMLRASARRTQRVLTGVTTQSVGTIDIFAVMGIAALNAILG